MLQGTWTMTATLLMVESRLILRCVQFVCRGPRIGKVIKSTLIVFETSTARGTVPLLKAIKPSEAVHMCLSNLG